MAELTTGFPKGNLEQYAPLLQAKLPKIATLILKTIDPLVCASLIDLLGSSHRFRKVSGLVTPRQDSKGRQTFEVRLVYNVPDFVGFTGGVEPIRHDQDYILQKLQQVPGVRWSGTAVRILPQDGSVTIMFDVLAGGAA